MIRFRNIVTAFLTNGDDFLLMERTNTKKLYPGYWAGVGGHIEPHEINDPRTACIREIYEETGIKEGQIVDLKLRYIVLRRSKNETVINYMYFGKSLTREVTKSDEGNLYWINRNDILNHLYLDVIRLTLAHYLEFGEKTNDILVGVTNIDENNECRLNWNVLKDMENLL
ncbi:MAG TPA: NUDIX domain-containing protein [Tissierellia bacterium]|nr:NUDIX domain-containing protein [Tissierellia bacterium]